MIFVFARARSTGVPKLGRFGRRLILFAGFVAAFSAQGLRAAPNVIFILCDDLGYGDLGVNWQNQREGSKKHRTPNLDQFADEGARMLRHYCPAPVCAPSRGSFLTGFHQGHCGIRNNQFDKALPDDHTIASLLKAGGYRTALVGKYGLQGKGKSAAEWPAYPTERGFDDFFGSVRHGDGHVHYPAHEWALGNSKGHRAKKEVWHNEREISASLEKCFSSDLFTAYAKKWIVDGLSKHPEQPFFLYLAYDTPHAALQYPPCAYPEGGGLQGGVQWLGKAGQMINTARGEVDSWVHPEHRQEDWAETEKRQAGMIRRLDEYIGDLVRLLKDLRIDEETLVVFTSDNGPHDVHYLEKGEYDASRFQAYGPFDGIKRDVLEGGIRMPALARWPKRIPAGHLDRHPSQFHDWMATFLAAADLPLPAQSDGVSLLPTLTCEGQQEEGTVYIEYQNNSKTPNYQDFLPAHREQKRGQQQVIFLEGYKGVRRNLNSANQPFQIYDVAADFQESKNLAKSSLRFEELEKKMQERVLQIRRPLGSAKRPYDQLPIPSVASREVEPGLEVLFQKGEFSYVPRLKGSELTEVEGLTFSAPEKGAVQFTGYLKVEKEGGYYFSIEDTATVVMHLHEALVLDTDHGSKTNEQARAMVQLAAGLHPFRFSCLMQEGAAVPGIQIKGPEGELLQDVFLR